MMVAAISEAVSADPQTPKTTLQDETQQNPGRPPLLPSERDNGVLPKRPKFRQVPSRYMSPSPSPSTPASISSSSSSFKRCPSPSVSRNSTPPSSTTAASVLKRSQSVDRRRPVAARTLTLDLYPKPGNVGEVSAAARLLVTSTRSLSVSFQGEAFSLPISKTKAAAPPSPNPSNARKGTPERRRMSTPLGGKVDGNGGQSENSKPRPNDQLRWPGRTLRPNPLSMSLDCSTEKELIGSGSVVRALQHSMIEESKGAPFDRRLSLDFINAVPLNSIQPASNGTPVNESSMPSDLTASDSDTVSSGSSTPGAHECDVPAQRRNGPRGIVVPARFWQETNSRLRRLQDSGSLLSTSPASKIVVPSRWVQSKKVPGNNPSSSPRTMSSPTGVGIRSPSPGKVVTSMASSPVRGISSPSRVRNAIGGTIANAFSDTPSVLSFAVDVRRGKVSENRIANAHLLRLFYNRHLQWRFVNAKTEATMLVQKQSAEKNLWNAWITISDLRDSVTKKRHRLQLMRQKLKLASILKGQVNSLEDWASLDKDNSISLLGAIEALNSSTLRLPVVGAISDIQSVEDAIGSAVDVMQAMASSICSLLSKVEEVNGLVTELMKVAAEERALLEQSQNFLSMLAAMQVKDFSLRTHILQLNHVPTA